MFQAKENIIQDFIDGKESAFKEILCVILEINFYPMNG